MTTGSSRGTNGHHSPRRSLRRHVRNGFRRNKPVLITTARMTRAQDRKKREWWYGLLQFLRVPLTLVCVGMYVAWDWVLIPVLLATLTFPLPWIAVIIANLDGAPQDKRQPRVYKPAVVRQAQQRTKQQLPTSDATYDPPRKLPPGIIDAEPRDSRE
ncbi:DUF3099 domain-containing protein [Corynebacterium pseudodiphtheriticum]|uniref:DUF3099 domain-containing protein n=1 Tax=Corynebacterium pseudodiphtheriticum TaxID=37637 RepID=UPI00253FD3A3|nr:DUF3099 domain-containing protein [Corynebacterium pseudodiphtheriticum]MDK4320979.1 DUF3099 domain-containing protein [Corynebacterium pseudodiphtheriticum]